MIDTKDYWQLQEAKNKLSQVVHLAEEKAQYITVRGKPAVVVLSVQEYQSLTRPKTTIVEFLQNSPLRDGELDVSRPRDMSRDVDL
jgi:prevent-host-death family protein